MLRVVMLDFDGVLHDDQVYWHPKRGIYVGTPGRALFEWMPVLEDLLAPYPDVKIVLSTSWVRVKSFDFAKKQLSRSLQNRVIGATFHRRHMRKDEFAALPRGVQIARDIARRKPQEWFAIDDEHEGWPEQFLYNYIRTDPAKGISEKSVQSAIRERLETRFR